MGAQSVTDSLNEIQEYFSTLKSALEDAGFSLTGIAPKNWAAAIASQTP